MAAPHLLEQKKTIKQPVYVRPRRRRPDHDILQKSLDFQTFRDTEYVNKYKTYDGHVRPAPISHAPLLSVNEGNFDSPSLYRHDFIIRDTRRPYIHKPTNSLELSEEFCDPISTYRQEYPDFGPQIRRPAIPNQRGTWNTGKEANDFLTTNQVDYMPSLNVRPRSPIINDTPYQKANVPMQKDTVSGTDFQYSYVKPRSSQRPLRVALKPGQFRGETVNDSVYVRHPVDSYLQSFVAEEWTPEKPKARPRHMRSPPQGQLQIPKKGRPFSPEVVPPSPEPVEKYRRPVGMKYNLNNESRRQANYSTTYNDDFHKRAIEIA